MSDFRGSLSVGLSVVGGGKGVTWFQPTFGLWEPNIPFEFRLIPAALLFHQKTLLSFADTLLQYCTKANHEGIPMTVFVVVKELVFV